MRTPSIAPWLLASTVAMASVAAISLHAAPAFAQEASEADIAQARQLGQQAQQAYDAGNYAESEKLWTAAQKLYVKAPTLSLGLARAQAKNGHVVEAQENYNKIIREWGNVPSASPAFKDAVTSAQNEVASVSSRVASVVITVEGPTSPQVTIDGFAINAAALGLRRPVDGGHHAVHAEAAGYKPADASFDVAEGGNAEAKLKLEKAPEGTAVVPPTPGSGTEPPHETGEKKSSNKTLAIVALGVGGVGLAVGAITGIIAIGKHGDLKDACPTGTCGSDKQSDVDSYKTMGTISTIGFIVGGVGIAAGAVLWFTAPKETASSGAGPRWATIKTKNVEVTPIIGATGGGFAGRF